MEEDLEETPNHSKFFRWTVKKSDYFEECLTTTTFNEMNFMKNYVQEPDLKLAMNYLLDGIFEYNRKKERKSFLLEEFKEYQPKNNLDYDEEVIEHETYHKIDLNNGNVMESVCDILRENNKKIQKLTKKS